MINSYIAFKGTHTYSFIKILFFCTQIIRKHFWNKVEKETTNFLRRKKTNIQNYVDLTTLLSRRRCGNKNTGNLFVSLQLFGTGWCWGNQSKWKYVMKKYATSTNSLDHSFFLLLLPSTLTFTFVIFPPTNTTQHNSI